MTKSKDGLDKLVSPRIERTVTQDEWPSGYRGPRDDGMAIAMYGIAPIDIGGRPIIPFEPWAPPNPAPAQPAQPVLKKPEKEPVSDTDPPPTDPNGYHKRKIAKGKLGEISKVKEECEEYEDSIEQGITIMAISELADIFGALKALAEKHKLSMWDLEMMNAATERAFQSGRRK